MDEPCIILSHEGRQDFLGISILIMKTVLAFIGGFTLFLSILGMLDIGNFVMMYSPDKITCTKETK
jgi:hypothetical protein